MKFTWDFTKEANKAAANIESQERSIRVEEACNKLAVRDMLREFEEEANKSMDRIEAHIGHLTTENMKLKLEIEKLNSVIDSIMDEDPYE